VAELQQALADRGNTIDIDGVFGPATAAVVKAFQQMIGLPTDGIAGPVTLAALGLGQYRVGDYPTLDALAADMANYLNTGAAGGLPADIVASLAWFVYTAPGPSPFIVVSIDPQSNGLATVTLSGLDQQGSGPVVVMQLCFQADAPFTWCGVVSVGADA
jgi:peptidoglycan hydrolase-like protein with peptidoglycan-binding domain